MLQTLPLDGVHLEVYITRVIGKELRAQRMEKDYSLGWLSGELGKSRSFLAAVERGEKALSVTRLEQWVRALSVKAVDRYKLLQSLLQSQDKLTLSTPSEKHKVDFLAAVFYALPTLRPRKAQEIIKSLLS